MFYGPYWFQIYFHYLGCAGSVALKFCDTHPAQKFKFCMLKFFRKFRDETLSRRLVGAISYFAMFEIYLAWTGTV